MPTDQKAEPPTERIPVRAFLNYASEDREQSLWLHDRLIEAGLQEVWLDRSDIKGGDQWKREIDRGLRQATVLLALLTKNSIDPSRRWVEYERSEAKRLFKPIIPLRFNADPPAHLKHLHYVDFSGNSRMNRELISAVWGDAGGHTSDALRGLYRRAMIKREPESKLYHAHPLLRAFAHSMLRKEPERMAAAQLLYRDFLTRTAEQGFSEREEQWSRMKLYTPHLLQTASELWVECKQLLGDLNALARPETPAAAVTLEDPAARAAALRAVRFVQAVMDYVLHRPGIGETGHRLLTLGLTCVRATSSEELLDTFARALGFWYARSDPPVAESYFEEALRWAEHTGDRAEQGKILSAYGELQRVLSRHDHAVELLGRALDIHQELDDPYMQATTLKSLGETYWRRCDFDTATGCYQRALEVYRDLGDRSGQADLFNKVGSVE